jgi:PDZ domain-containing protein
MANIRQPRRSGSALARRLDRILTVVTIVAVLLLIAVIVAWKVPGPYQIEVPATAQSVTPQIYVAGHSPQSGRGDLYMTFVAEPDTNLLDDILFHFDPDATIVPLPPNYNQHADQVVNQQLMLSSEQTAELVALCHLGYKTLCTGGVQVQSIEKYSKAKGILKANDVIVSINSTATPTVGALRAALGALKPGATVTLHIIRNGAKLVVDVQTVSQPDAPTHALLGVTLLSASAIPFPAKLPVDIKINPGNIGGPSAGLMFTLGILNRLSPMDLAHGLRIAGTGEIHIDGTVGAIGGVKQKVIGAQWVGSKAAEKVKYFLVPCDGGNYVEATKYVGKGMTLVPVNTLDDALKFLNSIGPGGRPNAQYKPATCAASAP